MAYDRSRLEVESLSDGVVSWTGSSGRSVRLRFADTAGETTVWRDGEPRDGDDFAAFVYRSEKEGPIDQIRLSGRITVRAGGAVFEGTVSEQGRYTFANR